MRWHWLWMLWALMGVGCGETPESELASGIPESGKHGLAPKVYGDLELPGDTPRLLMPKLLVEDQIEHGGVFALDLAAFYVTVSDPQYQRFTLRLVERQGEGWSTPRTVTFSGAHSDHAAYFPPSGEGLWFSSTRPRFEGEENPTWRLWSVSPQGKSWGEASWIRIPTFESRWQSHATSTADGVLYFHALKSGAGPDGGMDFDLYRSLPMTPTREESGLSPPLRLGPEINTEGVEVTAWVAADESFLLFAAYGRDDGYGHGDLYISQRSPEGRWQPARNLGPQINTEFEESNPSLTPDGSYLTFSSSRPLPTGSDGSPGLHLYWIRAEGFLDASTGEG